MIKIDKNIKLYVPECRLAYSIIRDVNVKGTPPSLMQAFQQIQTEVIEMFNLEIVAKIPRILAFRTMYKKLAIDPSRYRPSSEALVRRVLKNRGLNYINSVVDVNNYCSLKFLIPFGIYDIDQLVGPITYKIAGEGKYENISGNIVSTEGKPFLIDSNGIIGSPTADAHFTAVTLNTKNLLSVVYADEEVTDAELTEMLDFSTDMFLQYNNGLVAERAIVHV